MEQLWSYVLAAVGIVGIYVAGKKNYWGWFIGLTAQVLWIAYAVATQQWGFIASALVYGALYFHNWRKWRAEHRAEGIETAGAAS